MRSSLWVWKVAGGSRPGQAPAKRRKRLKQKGISRRVSFQNAKVEGLSRFGTTHAKWYANFTRSIPMTSKLTSISTPASRKKTLEAKLAETVMTSALRQSLDVDYQADPIDEVRSGIDRDVTIEQLNRRTQLGQEIRSALEKLSSGEYGICEECEEPISQRRLDVVPWARLCVKCQSRKEMLERHAESLGYAA
jgi:RNA polymerase-binding protein DksA